VASFDQNLEEPEDDVDNVVLERAKKNAAHAAEMWREIYNKAREDLHFLSDEPSAQWDTQDYETRTNRKKLKGLVNYWKDTSME